MGRPLSGREGMLRAFILKAVYNFLTTKVLIENLETNPSLRRLCCWEYRSQVPSEATFSRAFKEFSVLELPDAIHTEKEFEPAKKSRYNERTTVERTNSDLKDNYSGRPVRVKGHLKVFCHLMFGIIVITVKQLFNMLI